MKRQQGAATTPYSIAYKLLTLGYSVIPSGGGDKEKAPLVNWKPYQDKPADEAQLERWQDELNPQLWGIVTNASVAVIDADTPETRAKLEATLGQCHVLTPRGGGHWYIDTTGHPFKTVAGLLPGVDSRGFGGFINVTGKSKLGEYKIINLPMPGENLIPYTKLPKRILAALDGNKPGDKAQQPGTPIPEGERNASLASLAGALRRQGADQATIETTLLETNARRCAPPLPEQEVLTIAKSISQYEPKPDGDNHRHYNLTDYGNAERLASQWGDVIRYSPERKLWLIWSGKVWEWDIGGIRIAKLAKKTDRDIYREAADEVDNNLRKEIVNHARATERQVRLDAMISSAESEPGIAVYLSELDTNLWLLNVNNGTIDLKTGTLKPHDRADMITELLPIDYNPSASSKEWVAFLDRIFNHDDDLITYIQRAMGYSITGDQSEMVFFFCYGRGWNGKSTLLNTCRLVMGNYASQVPPSAFMVDKNKRGGPDEAIASLKNKRLVCATELEDGQRLSVSLVKRMTGGEPLWCEHKFERGYNFQPTHKLWLSGNHEPVITDTTNSIWYRLKKIPFTVEIPGADRIKGYDSYLAREHSVAILAWLVKGCAEWCQATNLAEPEAVRQAVAEYRDQQDILYDFLTERCLFKKSESIDQKALYANYKQWAEENDINAIGKMTFRTRLQEKGALADRGNKHVAIWRGIRLLSEEESVTSVTSVIENHQSFLHEAPTGKTLGKMGNESNKSNIINTTDDIPEYPHDPCGGCGGSDYWLKDDDKWLCSKCHPKPLSIKR